MFGDGQLYNIYWDGTAWHEWHEMGGDLVGPPAASSSGPDRMTCSPRAATAPGTSGGTAANGCHGKTKEAFDPFRLTERSVSRRRQVAGSKSETLQPCREFGAPRNRRPCASGGTHHRRRRSRRSHGSQWQGSNCSPHRYKRSRVADSLRGLGGRARYEAPVSVPTDEKAILVITFRRPPVARCHSTRPTTRAPSGCCWTETRSARVKSSGLMWSKGPATQAFAVCNG